MDIKLKKYFFNLQNKKPYESQVTFFIKRDVIESHSNIQEWYEAGTRHWEASVTREWENIAHRALMIGMATVVQFHRSVVFLEAQHGYSAALSSSVGPAFVWLAICIDSERWAQRWRWAGEGTCGSISRPVWLEQRFWRKEGWEKVWGM